jgi:two-component system sensor histidine kinase CpxA
MTIHHSLRAKFFWLALLNLAVLGLLLLLFIQHQLGREFQSFLMAAAREKIVAVSRQLSLDLAAGGNPDAILEQYSRTHGVEFRLYDSEGVRLAGPDAKLPPDVLDRLSRGPIGRTAPLVGPAMGPPPFLMEAGEPRRYWIGIRTLLPGTAGTNPRRVTLLLVSPTLFSNPFFFEWEPWLAILATAILVTLLCWLPLVSGLTRDIRNMTSVTEDLAEGRFDVQVDARRGDELGALGRAINQMAARLRDYLHGQKRFLGDAAHELRSPLGRMQVALGILEQKAGPASQEYVRDLQEDVGFLSGLTTELLTFARSEMKQEPVVLRPVALRSVVERAVDMEADGADVRIAIDGGLTAMGDGNLLFRAFSNLIRNAVRYAGESGAIEVSARRQDGRVLVWVADRGPGVPDEALDKLFTPFFRLDSSRERKKGGTGLGLAIVRSCIEACGGSVHAENRPSGGLLLIVRLSAA